MVHLCSSCVSHPLCDTVSSHLAAGAVLVGVLLNNLFHWWLAENVAALVFLFFLVAETREALEEARGEKDDDDD